MRLFILVFAVLLVIAGMTNEHPKNPIPVSVSHYEITIGFVTVRVDGLMIGIGIFLMVTVAIFHKLFSGTV